MMNQIDIYKIVVLGEGRVGKTSMSLRYVRGEFHDKQQSTINAVYLQKIQKFGNGKAIKFAIWDTAGQEKYNAIAPVYYRDAVGAIIVYQITSIESFEKVKKWINQLKQYAPKDIVIIVCGNKCDMENQRKVNNKQVDLYTKTYGASHYLVSAKSGAGIDQVFAQLADKIYRVKVGANTMTLSNKRNPKLRIQNEKSSKNSQQKEKKPCC